MIGFTHSRRFKFAGGFGSNEPPRTERGISTSKVQQDLLERRRRGSSRTQSRVADPLGSGPLAGGGNIPEILSPALFTPTQVGGASLFRRTPEVQPLF